MLGFHLIISTFILLISYSAFSGDFELEKNKAVVVIDDSNNIWWGKYISSDGDMVKVKLNPAHKNISYIGFDTFVRNVPRDKVFACIAAQSKLYYAVNGAPFRPVLTCANGIITNSYGNYFIKKQYTVEVDEINGIKRDMKIIAELKAGPRKVVVRRVFADGYIYFFNKKTQYHGWVTKDKVKLINKRPNFNKVPKNEAEEESTMVSLLESKSTIQ